MMSHILTMRYGPPYHAHTVAAPQRFAQKARSASIPPTPAADCKTFAAHLPGHSASLNGLYGQKWLEVPYFAPPVKPARMYDGQPITKWPKSW